MFVPGFVLTDHSPLTASGKCLPVIEPAAVLGRSRLRYDPFVFLLRGKTSLVQSITDFCHVGLILIEGDGYGMTFEIGLDFRDAFNGLDDTPYHLCRARSPASRDFQFHDFWGRCRLLMKSCQDGRRHDQNQ